MSMKSVTPELLHVLYKKLREIYNEVRPPLSTALRPPYLAKANNSIVCSLQLSICRPGNELSGQISAASLCLRRIQGTRAVLAPRAP